KPAVSKTNDDGAKKGSNKAADKKNADAGEDADNNDDDEDAEPKEFKSKSKSGILALDPFTVNLNDPFGRRYAEVVMNLEIEDKSYVTKISENELVTPKMRDEIFMIISAKSYSELKSTSGKVTLKEEILMRVNEILNEEFDVEPVTGVYFTKFLIQ
ncbi:MAG: flagellar basal body-associated FliL family protein, partial [bacterium]|nr:flagellar basal body-associated FliL family protein [bacterium]